ncbi:MAG: SH3 domain-containing protein [Spirochaetales bacterium]|nr:SH3 domain-containing protein [Spirochaetales bacterium]
MKTKIMLCFTVILLLAAACGPGKIGYGILLWQESESSLTANQLLDIYIDSSIRDTYTFTPNGREEMQEIKRWRVLFFEKKKDAEAFALDYEVNKHLFGKTLQNGLPVREKPDAQSERVYRLRLGEDVKILSRLDEPSEVGQYTGYWYKVLTKEGVQGFCFDVYLKIYDITAHNENDDEVLSQNLIKFFESSYVPDYYRNMIANNAIDLDRFKVQYGLFPDLDNKTISIVIENFQNEFSFDDISSPSRDQYVFEGTDLKIQFFRSTYINATFKRNGKEESHDFVVLNDVEAIIAEEQERRRAVLEAFIETSKILQSDAYGTLVLDEEGNFQWDGYARLSPNIIPADYGTQGTIQFNYFLKNELLSNYDGVVAFSFNEAVGGHIYFLYQIRDTGIQFTTLNGVNPRGKIFEKQSDDPVIMFFSYVRE